MDPTMIRRALALSFALTAVAALGAPPAAADEPTGLDLVLALEQQLMDVAERVRPSVVTLRVSGTSVMADDLPDSMDDVEDYLREHRPGQRFTGGVGTGFVVDDLGTIYTNAHVVNGASTIEVVFADSRRGKADLVGIDESSDVAVVRLIDPPKDLVPIALGDSDAVRVGQYALAVGSPLDLSGTFSVGHVSALNRGDLPFRAGPDAMRYQDFIQVDTPINQGNSGGPLLDIRGRVIGINTAIAGGYDGIGFAIPINMALGVGEQLVNTGRVRRGYLGIRMDEMDPDLSELYGIELASPVIILGVEPGSPAEAGSFQEQDIVLEFAGRPIRSEQDLVNAIANAPIGEPVEAVVYRTDGDEGRTKLKVTLIDQADVRREASARRSSSSLAPAPTVEDELRSVLDSHGLAFSLDGNKGALVTRVVSGSPAADAGLEAGDLIVQVEDTTVSDADAAVKALRRSKRPFVPVRYKRKGKTLFTAVERPR